MKSILILLLSVSFTFAQSPIAELVTDKGSGMASVVEVDKTETGGGHLGRAITAAHVVDNAVTSKLRFDDGQVAKNCYVLSTDATNDISVVRVWVPRGMIPLAVASTVTNTGHKLRMVGKKFRAMVGNASPPTSTAQIYADVELIPGDSGGPVLNESGELVGVISGGWFWYHERTWPARSSNVTPIRNLSKLP